MRRYEMMLIVTDAVEEDAALAVVERAKKALVDQGGKVVDEAWWGKRALAYEIDHRDHGFYAVLDVEASSEAVAEVERQLKILDEVVRFKTVRPDVRIRSHG
jgi:small subunit ribosomal protein S6